MDCVDKQKPRRGGRGFARGALINRPKREGTRYKEDGSAYSEFENFPKSEAVPNKKPDRMANTTVGLLSAWG